MKYKRFPERLLEELHPSVKQKIQSGEEFDLTEKEISVTKEFLQDSVIHVENICDSEASLISALDFYMRIGVQIPESTIKYVKNHAHSNGMNQRLLSYSNIIKNPVVTMNRLRGQDDATGLSVGVFTSLNIDRGTRRKNIYADNFKNLMRNIRGWTGDDATCFIRVGQEYDLVVDGVKIGVIKGGGNVTVVNDHIVDDFISAQFGEPQWMNVSISPEVKNGRCTFYWVCEGDIGIYSGSSSMILPSNTKLRTEMVAAEVKVITHHVMQIVRHENELSSDLFANIIFENKHYATVDKAANDLNTTANHTDIILDAIGVEQRPTSNLYSKDQMAESVTNTFIHRIFNFFKK